MQSERRSTWTLAAWALPCLPMAGLGLPLVVYLPEYYSSELGLSLAAVGGAFALVRLLDMAFDPFIGGVMDATRSPIGRFRLWFLISVPILVVASWMLFMAKPGVTSDYLLLWLLVVYAGTSISTLAQVAWGAVLSTDYDQRSRIYGWWQAGNVVGIILVLTLPAVLPLFGIAAHGAGVAAMGWFIVVLTPLTIGFAVWRVPEPQAAASAEKPGLMAYLMLFRRPNVVRLLIADFLIGAGPGITGALFFFFMERVKGFEKGEASLLLLVYFLGGLAGAPLWTRLATRFGKHRTLAASSLLYAAVTMCALLLPPGAMAAGALLMFMIGVPYAAGAFLLRAMMADVGDEERLEGGADRTGLLYALLSGTVKLSSAVAVFVAFRVLQVFGFDPVDKTSSQGLEGLSWLFVLAPTGLALAAAWLVGGFPLTAERHADIRRRLDERDRALAAEAAA